MIFLRWLFSFLFWAQLVKRPQFLALIVAESPSDEELDSVHIFKEVRNGWPKWAHLRCPKCGDHIQLPLAGHGSWSLDQDLLSRPTLAPSIWEKQSCGAHFFVRAGSIVWCRD
ncbi:MAG: DUF6527 family protein [Pseudomonadota bacterium]